MMYMNKLTRISVRRFSLDSRLGAMCLPKPDYGPVDVQRSALLNGIKLAASKPLGAQMGACTIMYQVGSRHEIDDEIGASHFVRVASSASGCSYSNFMKSRVLTQNGAALTCTTDRQSTAFTLRCPIHLFSELKSYLLDTATRCLYKEWEITDLKPLIFDDLHRIHPQQRVIDLVQRACWGGPLSNSIFCESERLESMSGKTLANFAERNMKTDICTIASVGVPFEETMKLAEMVEARREMPEPREEYCSFPRRGYEVYDLGRNSTTWIAVAVPGCGTCDLRCLLIHSIIAAACGTGNLQMGQHSMDRVAQLPLGFMAKDDIYTEYRAFNISYRETGVFGIVAQTRSCSAYNVAMAASDFLTNICKLNPCEIAIGKLRLKLSLAIHDEDCVKVSEGLALQLANEAQIDSPAEVMAMIDSICADEITCVANCLSNKSGDMALAVVGDLSCVPHDRQIVR